MQIHISRCGSEDSPKHNEIFHSNKNSSPIKSTCLLGCRARTNTTLLQDSILKKHDTSPGNPEAVLHQARNVNVLLCFCIFCPYMGRRNYFPWFPPAKFGRDENWGRWPMKQYTQHRTSHAHMTSHLWMWGCRFK